jgi:hypothetical protein
MKYGKDFIWAYAGYDDIGEDLEECITLMVKEEKYESFLQLAIQNNHKIKHTDQGKVKLIKARA